MSDGTKFSVCYIQVAVISEAVIKGEINIAKASKNSGPQDLVCYMGVTVKSVDVTTGYYCISFFISRETRMSSLSLHCVIHFFPNSAWYLPEVTW